jgi:hypothetical protein
MTVSVQYFHGKFYLGNLLKSTKYYNTTGAATSKGHIMPIAVIFSQDVKLCYF